VCQATLWQEGKDFQAGVDLQAMLFLSSHVQGQLLEELMSTFKTKIAEAPNWNQKISFPLDASTHVDLIFRIFLTVSGGRQEPWGLLRLPVAEILSRGSHQGWFFLSDNNGDPFRENSMLPLLC